MLRHNRIGALRPVREHDDGCRRAARLATTTPLWVSTSAKAGWCHDHQMTTSQDHDSVLE